MGLTRDKLERQLKLAEDDLAVWTKSLEGEGVTADQRRLEPRWRGLKAQCNALSRRIRAVDAVAARDAEAVRRKEAGDEAPSEE